MESLLRDLEKEIECTSCRKEMDNPLALPCQHTFCKDCLEPSSDGVCCPTCSERFPDIQDIQSVPVCSKSVVIVEAVRKLRSEAAAAESKRKLFSRTGSCSLCSKTSQLSVCVHCSQLLCPDCSKCHQEELEEKISRNCDSVLALCDKFKSFPSEHAKLCDNYKMQIVAQCSSITDIIEAMRLRMHEDIDDHYAKHMLSAITPSLKEKMETAKDVVSTCRKLLVSGHLTVRELIEQLAQVKYFAKLISDLSVSHSNSNVQSSKLVLEPLENDLKSVIELVKNLEPVLPQETESLSGSSKDSNSVKVENLTSYELTAELAGVESFPTLNYPVSLVSARSIPKNYFGVTDQKAFIVLESEVERGDSHGKPRLYSASGLPVSPLADGQIDHNCDCIEFMHVGSKLLLADSQTSSIFMLLPDGNVVTADSPCVGGPVSDIAWDSTSIYVASVPYLLVFDLDLKFVRKMESEGISKISVYGSNLLAASIKSGNRTSLELFERETMKHQRNLYDSTDKLLAINKTPPKCSFKALVALFSDHCIRIFGRVENSEPILMSCIFPCNITELSGLAVTGSNSFAVCDRVQKQVISVKFQLPTVK